MLFYRHKVVTKSIGLVLYHNSAYGDKHEDDLQNKFNVVAPCATMLKKALKLDRVHTFGDFSDSQIFEKLDFLIELSLSNYHGTTQGPKPTILITIINLCYHGLFAESEKEHKIKYETKVDQQFPTEIDSTTVFKNFS